MPFQKGRVRTGGRKKREETEVQKDFIEEMKDLLSTYDSARVRDKLKMLDPEKELKMLVSLSEFIYPKLARKEVNTTLNLNMTKKAFLIDSQNFYLDGLAPIEEETPTIDITPKQLPK